MTEKRKGGQATKDELAKNLFRAWYVAAASGADSMYFVFIENALDRHYGTAEFREMVEVGIETLKRDGMGIPDRMMRVLDGVAS